jgi:hypothetical protein
MINASKFRSNKEIIFFFKKSIRTSSKNSKKGNFYKWLLRGFDVVLPVKISFYSFRFDDLTDATEYLIIVFVWTVNISAIAGLYFTNYLLFQNVMAYS